MPLEGTTLEERREHSHSALRHMRVADVMTPRADIIAVPAHSSFEELLSSFQSSEFTRIPVYEESLDAPIGMAHLKDIIFKQPFGQVPQKFDLRKNLRPMLFVPPSMQVSALLGKMQAERTHLALVIDEYGGVDGLVTIEDLIEEIVGEIHDEHDTEKDHAWSLEKEGQYAVAATANLEDVERRLNVRLSDVEGLDTEDIDTIGGLISLMLGRVPNRGELVQHPSGIEFEVLDADPRRIKRLRMRTHAIAVQPLAS